MLIQNIKYFFKERIYSMNPETKIILLICDPVQRAFADFSKTFHHIPVANIPAGKTENDLKLAAFGKSVSETLLTIEARKRELSQKDFIQWIRNVHRKVFRYPKPTFWLSYLNL